MSCGVSGQVSDDRTKSSACRIGKVFSNSFSSAINLNVANNPGTSISAVTSDGVSDSDTPFDISAASSASVVAQVGGSGESSVPTEPNTLEIGGSIEAATNTKSGLKCKPRCLCWCYCCSCICVTPIKGKGKEKGFKNAPVNELLICEGEPIPALEEIRSWAKSFDTLMTSAVGRKVFGEFLKLEYSDENILFWLACEDLKLETNPDVIAEKVRVIYEGYVSILSPKEISLDSHVREIVNRNMVEPTTHTFDEAQMQIYHLMMRDSYPRFVNSALYKSLAQNLEQDVPEQSGTTSADHVGNEEAKEPHVQD